MSDKGEKLTIVVVGGSGDLAQRKIFPALFALYCQGHLPGGFNIVGFARSSFTHEAFRAKITEHLTCRYTPGESCADRMNEFLARCHYVSGQYGSRDSFLDLYELMRELEGGGATERMYYLAIPPSVFLEVAHAIGGAGLVSCTTDKPWSRVVIEKPFGRDRQSSDLLTLEMSRVFTESQTYRIDHYLGKEVIQNLMVLRFANLVFEPVWNNRFVESVQISWKEELGVEGRGGYFDRYGIIRDVVQNHMLQILALVAMEPPERLDPVHIAEEKVKVLKDIPPVGIDDVVLGQYTGGAREGRRLPGYTDDESVPASSITPTFAASRLQINNDRWEGVPFVIAAGKALDDRMNEIRVRFRGVPGSMFCEPTGCPQANEMVIRVQPDEAILLRVVNKVPGMGMAIESRDLDLQYKTAFDEIIPDAYESLLMDVLEGDKSLFIRSDELGAAWDIFTPVLHEIDERRREPEPYEFGSSGPDISYVSTAEG